MPDEIRFSSQALRSLRERAGLPQEALAEALGIGLRTLSRYELGAVEPRFSTALRMAEVLNVEIHELAGQPPVAELRGQWYARWEQSIGGQTIVTEQPVTAHDGGSRVPISADRRGTVTGGEALLPHTLAWQGSRWEGELRVYPDQVLVGHYMADDEGSRSRGSLYLILGPDATYAYGRWVSSSQDRTIVSGWSVLAREDARASSIMVHLLADGRP